MKHNDENGKLPPARRWNGAKLFWRDLKMRTSHPPEGSSPAAQQELGLNHDVTLRPSEGEGKKLRE